jgi:hypothetical protein
MDRKIKERLELALRPVEPPSIEEVLKQVSTHGVLRGPVDWVFPAWMMYVEYATQKIAETFPLSEEEKRQLFHFRDTMKRLLLKAWMQAKEKLTTLYKAVAEGTYRLEGKRLYAPDGVWIYVGSNTPLLKVYGVSAKAYFPDLLKLPRKRLELLQLGWRASDEGNDRGRPVMNTTQPWQVFAWVATRYGGLYICVDMTNLTREGMSVAIRITAKSWKQKWTKTEAVDLVTSHLKRGEWTPMLSTWLGDGKAIRKKALHGNYQLVITSKEPWKLGKRASAREALIASGREAFERLRKAAGVYGELLDLLKAHKWIDVKLATDDGFRTATKQNKKKYITVEGIIMRLRVASDTLLAEYYTCCQEKMLEVEKKLKSVGLRPNIVKSNTRYVVYIAMTDLLRLAEEDGEIRRTIAQYLAEKAKNGTPKQRETARKLLQRHPLFSDPTAERPHLKFA